MILAVDDKKNKKMASNRELTMQLAKEEGRRKALDAIAKGDGDVDGYIVAEDPILWDIVQTRGGARYKGRPRVKVFSVWNNGSPIELETSWNAAFLGERNLFFYPDGNAVKMDLALSLDFPSGNNLTGTLTGLYLYLYL